MFFTSTHFNFQLNFKIDSCIHKKNNNEIYSLHSFSWKDVGSYYQQFVCKVKWNEIDEKKMYFTQTLNVTLNRENYFIKFIVKCWWKETNECRTLTLWLILSRNRVFGTILNWINNQFCVGFVFLTPYWEASIVFLLWFFWRAPIDWSVLNENESKPIFTRHNSECKCVHHTRIFKCAVNYLGYPEGKDRNTTH